jgi:hypothetical protein
LTRAGLRHHPLATTGAWALGLNDRAPGLRDICHASLAADEIERGNLKRKCEASSAPSQARHFWMMMNKRLFLLLAAFALIGCATQNNQLGTEQRLPEPGMGYVLASLAYEVPSDAEARTSAFVPSLAANVAPADGGSGKHFQINASAGGIVNGLWSEKKLVIDEGSRRRVVLLVPVQPGKYKVNQYYTSFPAFGREVFIDAKNSPTFEVRDGEIAYAGSMQLSFTVGRTLLGQLRPNLATVKLVHDFDKDLGMARGIDSRLSKIEVRDALKPR